MPHGPASSLGAALLALSLASCQGPGAVGSAAPKGLHPAAEAVPGSADTEPAPWTPAQSLEARPDLAALLPRDVGALGGICPQVDVQGRSDDALRYELDAEGVGVKTRFIGPSEALGVGLVMERRDHDGWSELVARVAHSDHEVALAAWTLDEHGRVLRAWTRSEPFVEFRALGIRRGQLVSDVEWRPYVDGRGVGEWVPPPWARHGRAFNARLRRGRR